MERTTAALSAGGPCPPVPRAPAPPHPPSGSGQRGREGPELPWGGGWGAVPLFPRIISAEYRRGVTHVCRCEDKLTGKYF